MTVEDLSRLVDDAVRLLRTATDRDWSAPAHGLDWTCWETVEHTADDLFAYAGQLARREPSKQSYVPFGCPQHRPGGPRLTVYAEQGTSPDGLCDILEASAGLLVATATVADPALRAWHPSGVSDPEGFVAMGAVEVLVHLHDVATALGLAWTPDEDLCGRVLHRLFPDAPAEGPRWDTLLWATGHGTLPGRDRLLEWRWDGRPRYGART